VGRGRDAVRNAAIGSRFRLDEIATVGDVAPTRAPVTPLGLEFSTADIGYCVNTGESYEASDGHIDDLL
jgi:hypothetical protein